MKRNENKSRMSFLAASAFVVGMLIPSGTAEAACSGTVYFQAPSSWTSVCVYYGNTSNTISSDAYDASTGFYKVDMSTIAGNVSAGYFFYNCEGNVDYPGVSAVDDSAYNYTRKGRDQNLLTCPGDGNSLYVMDNPTTPGVTYEGSQPINGRYFYFLLPEDEDWMSTTPMLSADSGVTGVAMTADTLCGWYYYVYAADKVPDKVVIYRNDDTERSDMLLWNGAAIALKDSLYDNDHDRLYFVPDDGLYRVDPGVEGSCTYDLAALIYDTDASLHGAFTCVPDYYAGYNGKANACDYPSAPYQLSSQTTVPCLGITPGIVEDTLDANKKPIYKASSGCFPSAEAFNVMFRQTAGVNEEYCYNIAFTKGTDNKWEFDSDKFRATGATATGGFYPNENSGEGVTYIGDKLPAAETKRKAEGPVFYCKGLRNTDATENVPKIDLLCNGAGWNGGYDCTGLFLEGGDLATVLADMKTKGDTVTGDGFGWGCPNEVPADWPVYTSGTEDSIGYYTGDQTTTVPSTITGGTYRWTSGDVANMTSTTKGRNQQFCFESHAQFKYVPGQVFQFRGDDDIWVFLGGRLAVDLGGTHLAAPAYVKLDNLTDKDGNKFVAGKSYDLDIFFCDRRTTMSNVRIKTNMYIEQTSGLYLDSVKTNTQRLCYQKTGDATCAAVAMGSSSYNTTTTYCGDSIQYAGISFEYSITKNGKTVKIANGDGDSTTLDNTYFTGSGTYFGGITIDKGNYTVSVDTTKMGGLPPGTYYLVISVSGDKTSKVKIRFKIHGILDVLNANAVNSERNEQTWTYRNSALAGKLIPVYITAVADEDASGVLQADTATAINNHYSLTTTGGLVVYSDSAATSQVLSTTSLVIDSSGVDTVWVTIPASSSYFSTASQAVGDIQVTGRSRVAALTFTLPKIAFVDSSYSHIVNPAGITAWTSEENLWVGAYYTAHLAVYDPTTQPNLAVGDTVILCTTCNIDASIADYSAGMNFSLGSATFENGKLSLMFNSSKEYDSTTPASFTVVGAGNANVAATWTGLIFKKPPVPYPEAADIYDGRGVQTTYNGLPDAYTAPSYLDGIADSLRIVYSRPFPKDSLPDSIQVRWAASTDPDSMVILTKAEILAATKLLAGDTTYDSVLTFGGNAFSSKVKTGGAGTLTSYTQYKSATFPISSVLTDNIAPIITNASITESKLVSGYFTAMFQFSEPVKITDLAGDGGKTSFSYYLRSATDKDVNGRYQASAASSFSLSGDSVATLVYQDNGSTDIPAAGDFARIRADLSIITDTLGNKPTDYTASVASPWIELQGDASSHVISISLTNLDKETMENRKNSKDQITAYGVDIYASKDSIRAEYPGTLGYIIQTDMGQILSSSADYIARIDKGNLKLSDVKLHYENYIFTNLGEFVASSKKTVACNDPMFSSDGKSEGDCRTSRKYVYVSWNLMSSDKRFVGSGAYISKLSTYISIGSNKDYKHNVTQTWGVMRGNGKIK